MPQFDTTTLSDVVSRPAILGPLILFLLYIFHTTLWRPSHQLPQNLPIIGLGRYPWLFPLTRTRWSNAFNLKPSVLEAYRSYKDKTCILPVAGTRDFVLIPEHEVQWFLDQPDTVFSIHESTGDILQLEYTAVDPDLFHKPVHQDLIPRRLTREVGNLVPELLDEIRASIDTVWGETPDKNTATGSPTPTREVNVLESMKRVVGRVTNRIFIGLPWCRDETLLAAGIAYAEDVPFGGMLIKMVWKPLRPLFAPFITIPNRIHTRRFYNVILGEVKERLRVYHARKAVNRLSKEEKKNSSVEVEVPKNDYLEWLIQQADELGDPYFAQPDTLAGRLLLLNFAAIHTSSFAITNVLLDLVYAGRENGEGYIAELREEISAATTGQQQPWDKYSLAAMPKLDSTLRESQRLNTMVTVNMMRVVVAPDGITTPSGVYLPRGTAVATHSYSMMRDPNIYPDPDVFKPFRFAEKRGVVQGEQKEGEENNSSNLERASLVFATTGFDYTPFGHGRNACPGRFFASVESRLLLAYIVMHYDFVIQDGRPGNDWFSLSQAAPMNGTIKIKRRAGY